MTKNRSPEPEEGIDYYVDEWCNYTINIEVSVDALKESNSDSELSNEAVRQFREGAIDGNVTIVHSEKIKDVELDYKTDLPFNREAWQISKCAELGFHPDGTLLRPWEKELPISQAKLGMFGSVIIWQNRRS